MSAYRKYRLRHMEPLDVAFTSGLLAIIVLGIAGLLETLVSGLRGLGWDALLELPFFVGIRGLQATIGAFILTLIFNLVCHFTGGITVTYLDVSTLRNVQDENNDEPVVVGPPKDMASNEPV